MATRKTEVRDIERLHLLEELQLLFTSHRATRLTDGCSSDCLEIEDGFTCEEAGEACSLLCGNGRLDPGEYCDEGKHNGRRIAGCSINCRPFISPLYAVAFEFNLHAIISFVLKLVLISDFYSS